MLVSLLLLLSKASLDSASEPPHLPSSRHWEGVEGEQGRALALRCPVTAELYRWYHNQWEITLPASPPYQLAGRRLSISSLRPQLAGNYTCKAVNGFGTASYSFLVSVQTGQSKAGRRGVLVEGVLQDRRVEEGEETTLTCSLHSLHHLSLAWGRKLQPGTGRII